MLRRFWFEFEKVNEPTPFNMGCGITAYDYADAVRLLNERVLAREALGKIVRCQEDIDVSALDKNHILPNIGSVVERGIWFPLGY